MPMKIAYFGSDWYIGCIDVFIKHGHQISHIFICHNQPYNQQLLQYALKNSLPIINRKPNKADIDALKTQGVNCIFSAEYSWLIPVDNELITINLHPTLLPHGRGPTPIIWLLKEYPEQAGITFHRLSDKFDQGDIIYQTAMKVNDNETWETFVAKLKIKVPLVLDTLLDDFDSLYKNAKKQTKGSYWPKIALSDRTIDWNDSVVKIERLSRACGRFGAVIDIEGSIMLGNFIQASICEHSYAPGRLIVEDNETYTVAASDGIVVVIKSNITERLKT